MTKITKKPNNNETKILGDDSYNIWIKATGQRKVKYAFQRGCNVH